jgi:thymidylate synthase
VFLFTMLQELFAAELGAELGVYYHSVSSLHLYTKHVQKARGVLEDTTWRDLEMPQLSYPDELPHFLDAERALRLGASDALRIVRELPDYWRQLAEILACYRLQRDRSTSPLNAMSKGSLYRDVLGSRLDDKVGIHE